MNEKIIKCLLVEDNPIDAKLVEAMLLKASSHQMDILSAKNLQDALGLLDKQYFDVIVLDLRLPDSDGIDTFRKIYRKALKIPVIILTAIDDESLAIQTIKEGAQDYIIKGQINERQLAQSISFAIARMHLKNDS
ncbi:MAG TPA: response regulator [Candidatus Omnitrophota bacterium]|nr:response regulator [Candidatus Omnitrophota bacterium]HPN88861.1 response regulator [Candidatus Omnitrophota bacterium]